MAEMLDTFPMRNMATMDPSKSGGEIGRRLIPQIIDAYAEHEPDRIWGTQARSDDISEGFSNITFKQLAQCVDALAWFIHERIGRSSTFEAISYIGSADLRYCMFAWAAVKCGYQVRGEVEYLIWSEPATLTRILRLYSPQLATPSQAIYHYCTIWTVPSSSARRNGSAKLRSLRRGRQISRFLRSHRLRQCWQAQSSIIHTTRLSKKQRTIQSSAATPPAAQVLRNRFSSLTTTLPLMTTIERSHKSLVEVGTSTTLPLIHQTVHSTTTHFLRFTSPVSSHRE